MIIAHLPSGYVAARLSGHANFLAEIAILIWALVLFMRRPAR